MTKNKQINTIDFPAIQKGKNEMLKRFHIALNKARKEGSIIYKPL